MYIIECYIGSVEYRYRRYRSNTYKSAQVYRSGPGSRFRPLLDLHRCGFFWSI